MRTHSIFSGLVVATVALCTAAARAQDGTARTKEAAKAADVLAAARKVVGPVDGVRTLAVDASVQRNVNEFQMSSDVEMLLRIRRRAHADRRRGADVAPPHAYVS